MDRIVRSSRVERRFVAETHPTKFPRDRSRFLVFQEFHEPDRVKVKITLLFRRKISANVNRIHENRQRGREREREVRERLQQPFHIPSREIPSRRNFDPVHRKIDFSRTRNPSLSPFAIIVTNTSRETIVGEDAGREMFSIPREGSCFQSATNNLSDDRQPAPIRTVSPIMNIRCHIHRSNSQLPIYNDE